MGINFVLSNWDPVLPQVVSSIWVFIGIGLFAGFCLTPLFHCVHPKAVAIQGATLAAALGVFVATLPLALGADWPNVPENLSFGPTAKPFFQFVILATYGTVGGIIVGLIGWPKLKRSWENHSVS